MGVALTFRLVLMIGAGLAATPATAADIPEDFVYLRDTDPTIQQDMRYAGADNFTGRPVPGYDAGECVLVRQAAEALKAVQADVKTKGLSLKVYDCYRPKQAVGAFVAWAKALDDPNSKAIHYPSLDKAELFPQGYIATVSGHSRGSLSFRWTPIRARPRLSNTPLALARRRLRTVKSHQYRHGDGFRLFRREGKHRGFRPHA